MIHDTRYTIQKSERGQSMVEMIVAISIVSVSLLGILVLVNRALGVNKTISEQYTATYLASEGIELVKNMFDHSFLVATAGSKNFYGWVDPGTNEPNDYLQPGIYEADLADDTLIPMSGSSCTLSGVPTKQAVSTLLFTCGDLDYLNFDSTGIFSYGSGSPTKFKRVIIIDSPVEYATVLVNLDYRVTSAVGWESKGGKFTVQLEDYFLPWRIP